MELKYMFPDLFFIEDYWEDLLRNGSFSDIVILTNQEGRANTPSLRMLAMHYPQLLSDMFLCARSITSLARPITNEPVISILQDAAFYHAPVYLTETHTGKNMDLHMFIALLNFILDNYIREAPQGCLHIMFPPDRGDPNFLNALAFLNDKARHSRHEIAILLESA